MDVARKLQIKPGTRVFVGNAPDGFVLELPEGARLVKAADDADAVLAFMEKRSDVAMATAFLGAALADRLAYVAYPKGGRRGTDLNRDILWELLAAGGIRPVRQVSLDDVWPALRFRPA